MVSLADARAEAERFLDVRVRPQHPHEVIILDDYVQDQGDSWLFPYNGKAFVESGHFPEMLVGNTPIRVFKETGTVDFDQR